MIVPEEELYKYLGKDLGYLEGRVSPTTVDKLKQYNDYLVAGRIDADGPLVIDYLFMQYQKGKSIGILGKEIGVDGKTMKKVFSIYGFPTLTRVEAIKRGLTRMKQDPVFRVKQAEAAKQNLTKMRQDPVFRVKLAEASRQSLARLKQDPAFKVRNAEATRQKWKDPEFRVKLAEAVRRTWQDPERKARHVETLKQKWKDPRFRKKIAEANRLVRLDPINLDNYLLRSIAGYRADIGMYAQSTWEANLARIFLYCGREFLHREKLRLRVDNRYAHMFGDGITDVSVDFLITDPRGRLILYEIAAGNSKGQKGYAKLEMIAGQYPEIQLRTIGEKTYKRLESCFEDGINSCGYLTGWETGKDNLKTNPQKWGSTSTNA